MASGRVGSSFVSNVYWHDCEPVDGYVVVPSATDQAGGGDGGSGGDGSVSGSSGGSGGGSGSGSGGGGGIGELRDRFPGRMVKGLVLNESLAEELWAFSERLITDATTKRQQQQQQQQQQGPP